MLRINIVGIGPGNPELLTAAADKAVRESNILIGDQRMLEHYKTPAKVCHSTIKTSEIVAIAQAADPERDVIAILVSGDVGFFSLAKTISGKLPDCLCTRYCGISSMVYFASKINMSWDDAKIVSMHGRQQNLAGAVAHNKKVFSLTGGDNSVQALCRQLCELGLQDVSVYVGENLSYPEEKITVGTAVELSNEHFDSLAVMMIINENVHSGIQAVHGLDDSLFVRSKVPMTKQEVRSVSMSKLQPLATDVIYDIGAGTGSCSIELARLAHQGKVYAFERNALAVELIEKNKAIFNATNLEICPGEALANILHAPAPDCVFVGGSRGDLCEMLDIIYSKNSSCRVVINAITVETLAETAAYYQKHPEYELDIVNIFAARGKKLGNYNLMMAQNPVYVMTALKKEDLNV
ncbi:MAG: precorrin-6y C5,15-methyltransferase (decarboxylating) subunit CbiE [Acidaminococcaceae bacterium]|nr:precorrin-6y C5,15-methyltransferase (decarboxylating) subunit CbiE [Acidaminococcaceae bacterium]